MNISVTVGILILTVFLSLSAPAYAEDAIPNYKICMAYGSVNYTDGTPADGELVTIYKLVDPINKTTVMVGEGFDEPGWYVVNLYTISGNLTNGDIIVAEVRDKNTTGVADTSNEGITDPLIFDPLTVTPPVTNGDGDGDGSGSGSGSGTYLPTPTATPAPTATSEPTVTATDAPTDAPTEAPPKDSTSTQTKLETEFKTQSTPGFGAVSTVFAIAGMLATYLVMRRRE